MTLKHKLSLSMPLLVIPEYSIKILFHLKEVNPAVDHLAAQNLDSIGTKY